MRFFATRSGRREARARTNRTIFKVCKDPSQMLPKTLSLCQKLHFARLNGGNKFWGTCKPINTKTGVSPLGGAPGAVQEGPGPAGRTEQDAFLAHPRQVRRLKMMKYPFFPAPVVNCHFVGVGVRSNAHGLLFFPREGGSAGPLCPLSVTPADRKNPNFHVFPPLVRAKQRLARAQRNQRLWCAKIHHRCFQRRFLCAKSSILPA